MRQTRSTRLFTRAQKILPGGVDSPVRAFKSVGASPLFIRRASGARIVDIDGNRFIDYVMSWGPLIHGHAPKGLVRNLAAAAARGSLDAGLVVNAVTPTALRFAPPLLVSDREIDEAVEILGAVLRADSSQREGAA